jgi:hypothetical protein
MINHWGEFVDILCEAGVTFDLMTDSQKFIMSTEFQNYIDDVGLTNYNDGYNSGYDDGYGAGYDDGIHEDA